MVDENWHVGDWNMGRLAWQCRDTGSFYAGAGCEYAEETDMTILSQICWPSFIIIIKVVKWNRFSFWHVSAHQGTDNYISQSGCFTILQSFSTSRGSAWEEI
jgi:hypothetical protein